MTTRWRRSNSSFDRHWVCRIRFPHTPSRVARVYCASPPTGATRMHDIEIESLLNEAGYRYDAASGRYDAIDGDEDQGDYATEDVADQLEIPVEDLLRWEQEQQVEKPGD